MELLVYQITGFWYWADNSAHLCSGGRSKLTTYSGATVDGSGGYKPVSHVSLYLKKNHYIIFYKHVCFLFNQK